MPEQHIKLKNFELGSEDSLFLLSELQKYPALSQRELSKKLDMSLGKINYLLNALIKRGMLKIKSFSKKPGKLKIKRVHYILTHRGIQEKIRLTYHFLKKKEAEYNRIKKEWESSIINSGQDDKVSDLSAV